MRVTTEQALAWRLRRQALDHPADEPVTSVADRVLATRGWPFDAAALSVAIRRIPSDRGALAHAVDRGDVIRAYALRGGSYLFTPAIAAVLLAVRTAAGHSSSQRFQRQGGFTLDDWGPLRATCGSSWLTVRGPAARSATISRPSRHSAPWGSPPGPEPARTRCTNRCIGGATSVSAPRSTGRRLSGSRSRCPAPPISMTRAGRPSCGICARTARRRSTTCGTSLPRACPFLAAE